MTSTIEVDMAGRIPLVVVLGATGTGKSKLAIELAQRFAGEIISADSMQVYRGLDIITAKVTAEERATVPHHMLDLLHPQQEFTVHDFRNQALPLIKDVQSRGRLPVVVGGTNYYIESLLWQLLVDATYPPTSHDDDSPLLKRPLLDESAKHERAGHADTTDVSNRLVRGEGWEPTRPAPSQQQEEEETGGRKRRRSAKEEADNAELHRRLQEVDPESASRLHPNDRRKVLRALEVAASGRKLSELLEEQKQLPGGGQLGGPLRFPDAILLWLTADMEVLDRRLDARVDSMLEAGLTRELTGFHDQYNQYRLTHNKEADYTRGVFQSIGFKEFHDYLILNEAGRATKEGQALLKKGIEELKMVTRRYARRQNKWINNRFLRKPFRQVPSIYKLDCTDTSQWHSNVYLIAEDIVKARLAGETPNHAPVAPHPPPVYDDHEPHTCEVCQRLFVGGQQWQVHLSSGKHRRMLAKQAKERNAIAIATTPQPEATTA